MVSYILRPPFVINFLILAIWTAAMSMLGGADVSDQCRKPDIMADAAYVILTKKSRNYTGNFAIDEAVLKEVGVTDFNHYSVKPGRPKEFS